MSSSSSSSFAAEDPDVRKRFAFADLTDLHRMFLRLVVARRSLPAEEARALLQHVALNFAPCTGKRDSAALSLEVVVRDLAEALRPFKLALKMQRAENDGRSYLVYVSGDFGEASLARAAQGSSRAGADPHMHMVLNCVLQRLMTSDRALSTRGGPCLLAPAQRGTQRATPR